MTADFSNLSPVSLDSNQFYGLIGITTEGTARLFAPSAFSGTEVIQAAVSDEATHLTVGTNKLVFRMPRAGTLTAVRASVTTAPTGANLIVDINLNGVSILGTKLSIDATERTSTTAAAPATIITSSLPDDGEITIDIDQVGATFAGAGLKVTLLTHYVPVAGLLL